MKILKIFLSLIAALILVAVITGIWFASQLSATYPPIESYMLDMDKSEFESKLQRINSLDEYTITFTDTTGLNLDSEYSFYFNVFDTNQELKFLLKFTPDNSYIFGERIKLELIGSYDIKLNKSTYQPDKQAEQTRLEFETRFEEIIKN